MSSQFASLPRNRGASNCAVTPEGGLWILVKYFRYNGIEARHIIFQGGGIFKKSFHAYCPELLDIGEGVGPEIGLPFHH